MENFAQKALEAFWNAVYKDEDMPMPEVEGITFSRNGRTVTFSGPGFTETGDLTNLVQVIEKVWWRLGWSDLIPVSQYSSSYIYFHIAEDTCYELGEDIVAFCKELNDEDALEVLYVMDDTDALEKFDQTICNKILPDDSDLFSEKLFNGKDQAKESTLLKSLVEMVKDPRPLQRRECIKESAELIYGDNFLDIHTIIPAATKLFETAKTDDTCIQEITAHLAGAITYSAVQRRAFEYALPFLDYCVEHGPRFAIQYARRWKTRLALGLEGAEDDWKIFSDCVYRTAELCEKEKKEKLIKDLKLFRINGLLRASESALYQRDGWPTDEYKRKKTKKAIPVPEDQQKHFDAIRIATAKEALLLIEEIEINESHPGMTLQGSSFGSDYDNFYKSENYKNTCNWLKELSKPGSSSEEQEAPGKPKVSTGVIPAEFDYNWIIDEKNKNDILKAVSQWGMPWEEFPQDHASAKGTPLAEVLVAKATEYIRFTDDLAQQADDFAHLAEYEDREKLSQRFQEKFMKIIEIPETRNFNTWIFAFNYAKLTNLFFGYDAYPSDQTEIINWLRHVINTESGDEDALLETLPGIVYENMSDSYRSIGPTKDLEHYLAWSVTAQVQNPDLTLVAMKLYQPVFTEGWTLTAVPPASYTKTADKLEIPETNERFAKGLIGFIKEVSLMKRSLELMPEKWLWPLGYLWHPSMENELRDYLAGKWDSKKLNRAKRTRRLDFFGWLLNRVHAPELKKEYTVIKEKNDKRKR